MWLAVSRWRPELVLAVGFILIILLGALLLALPFSSAAGGWTRPVDALFTATGAACGALVVLDTGTYWSPIGQVVVLVLVQVGGLGYMTGATALLLLIGRRVSLRERVIVGTALGGDIGTVLRLARRIIVFSLIAQSLGAALLAIRFLGDLPAPTAAWWGIFHSVSAFNNAGLDLTGGFRSLTAYRYDAWVLGVIGALIAVGGLGYSVVTDTWTRRSWLRLKLESKLVLVTSGLLFGSGTLALLALESRNPATLGPMSPAAMLLNAAFLSVSARSGGFSSIDLSQSTDAGLAVLSALMFIGGASASTAGGIKVTTFGLLFFAILSALRGSDRVEAFQREIPLSLVLRALAVALVSVALVYLATLALTITDGGRFLSVLFEVASAFGSAGLSTGMTPALQDPGKLLLIVTMYIGRLGPLTLALALASRQRPRLYRWASETTRVG
jgi:trk system potassium uptake protein